MRTLVGVMIAGALGAAARYGLDGLVSDRVGGSFPWGTMVINLSGSLAVGFVFTLLTERVAIDTAVRFAITTGFIGSYTTFSTWTLETARLIQDRSYLPATANALGSLGLGLVAVGAGIVAARAV